MIGAVANLASLGTVKKKLGRLEKMSKNFDGNGRGAIPAPTPFRTVLDFLIFNIGTGIHFNAAVFHFLNYNSPLA